MRIAVVAAAVCLLVVGISVADDARAAMRRPTSIPAQSLGSALKVLAQARDLQVLYLSDSVRDVRTGGATGELTTDEALTQLLSGTGLTYRYVSDKAITILPVGGADSSQPTPPPSGGQAPNDKEGKKSSSDPFRVAQVDQGQTPSPSTVEKQDEQGSQRKPVQLEEVIVTGSRIPTVSGQQVVPVRTYARQEIEKLEAEAGPLHDPCVIAYLLAPSLFSGRNVNVAVETQGEFTLGETVVDWHGITERRPSAFWINEVDADGFYSLLTEAVRRLP